MFRRPSRHLQGELYHMLKTAVQCVIADLELCFSLQTYLQLFKKKTFLVHRKTQNCKCPCTKLLLYFYVHFYSATFCVYFSSVVRATCTDILSEWNDCREGTKSRVL